ncbi:MAG: RNA 3'-terminal phosphate cyclase [Conexivisphaerales archaeon]
MIRIDGSLGEGGGQILRTSLLFSLVQGKEVEIYNVRAKRDKPGLRPQHLAVVTAFASVTGGRVDNARVGSDWVRFCPSSEVTGSLEIDVGTAGSVTLILQTLLSAISLRGLSYSVRVRGGTDTRWSPTYDYFENVYEPAAAAFGVQVSSNMVRRGYYPEGGGLVEGHCLPASLGEYVSLDSAPASKGVRISSVCANLPRSVAARQADSAAAYLRSAGESVEEVKVDVEEADSPGTSILVHHREGSAVFLGGDAVGERGVKAEDVGAAAAASFTASATKGASVDHHLADMLVPLMALQGGGEVLTDDDTQHLRTNLEVAAAFTGCLYSITKEGALYRVRILKRD